MMFLINIKLCYLYHVLRCLSFNNTGLKHKFITQIHTLVSGKMYQLTSSQFGEKNCFYIIIADKFLFLNAIKV